MKAYSVLTTTIIALAFAWWSYTSNIILLKHYNAYVFNLDSNSYQMSFEKVLPKNIEKGESLEISLMGIGWPLKAVFMLAYFSPILLVIYFLNYLIFFFVKKKTFNNE